MIWFGQELNGIEEKWLVWIWNSHDVVVLFRFFVGLELVYVFEVSFELKNMALGEGMVIDHGNLMLKPVSFVASKSVCICQNELKWQLLLKKEEIVGLEIIV